MNSTQSTHLTRNGRQWWPRRWGGSWIGFALALWVCQLTACSCSAQTLDEKGRPERVAWVGEVALAREDFLKELNRLIPQQFFHAKLPDSEQVRIEAEALQSLIEKELIAQWGVRSGIGVTDDEVWAEVKRVITEASSSEQERYRGQEEQLFEKYGDSVRRRLLIAKCVEQVMGPGVDLSDEDLRREFSRNSDRYRHPSRVRLSHMLISVAPSASSEEAKELHQLTCELREQIEGGKAFADLARLYSADIYAGRGGDVGWVGPGELRYRALDDQVFKSQVGALSEVTSTLHGYHLFRVEQREAGKPMAFDEAKPALTQHLEQRRLEQRRQEWLQSARAVTPVRALYHPGRQQNRAGEAAGETVGEIEQEPESRPRDGGEETTR